MTTKSEMLDLFIEYRKEVTTALETVHTLLDGERYADASKAMTAISTTQARTSVAMRREMIRAGLIKEDE